jgi:hypothetical protein
MYLMYWPTVDHKFSWDCTRGGKVAKHLSSLENSFLKKKIYALMKKSLCVVIAA